MSVTIKTSNANSLLAKIKKFLSDGKSKTWAVDSAGEEITHTPEQWNREAYFTGTANEKNNEIKFSFSKVISGTEKTWEATYPYYHGRFVSFLFDHFNGDFSSIVATQLPKAK